MAGTAQKTDPKLWERVKAEITHGAKGGKPDQWSARKAQLATAEYKKRGGEYAGAKDPGNHLTEWTREEWGTKSGSESGQTGERYLPKKARAALSDEEYRSTTAKKRADTKKGQQFSRQPDRIAQKAARHRASGTSKADLLVEARRRGIRGRSAMSKGELEKALA